MNTLKDILENIKKPLQQKSMEVDRLEGAGQSKRAARKQEELDLKKELAKKVINTPLRRPRGEDESPKSSSSDEEEQLRDSDGEPVDASQETWAEARKRVCKGYTDLIRKDLREKIRMIQKEKVEEGRVSTFGFKS